MHVCCCNVSHKADICLLLKQSSFNLYIKLKLYYRYKHVHACAHAHVHTHTHTHTKPTIRRFNSCQSRTSSITNTMHKIHLFTAEATGQQERWGWNGLRTQDEMTSTNLLFSTWNCSEKWSLHTSFEDQRNFSLT